MEGEPTQDADQYWTKLIRAQPSPIIGAFETLQRQNLILLQDQLAELKKNTWESASKSKENREKLTSTIHQYVQAIRDWEYISKLEEVDKATGRGYQLLFEDVFKGHNSNVRPFNTTYCLVPKKPTTEFDLLRDVLRNCLHRKLTWKPEEIIRDIDGYEDRRAPTEISDFVERLAQFLVALAGGASLIVPMAIMVFDPSLTKSLVVTSVAVSLFALVLSFSFQSSNTETLTATATYAAVLVVFVGTSWSGGSF